MSATARYVDGLFCLIDRTISDIQHRCWNIADESDGHDRMATAHQVHSLLETARSCVEDARRESDNLFVGPDG
jgi:dsDNA-binding SOS-regulon protein